MRCHGHGIGSRAGRQRPPAAAAAGARPRALPAHRPNAGGGNAATASAVQTILDAAAGRGVSTPPEARARIMAAVEELKRAGAGSTTTDAASLVRCGEAAHPSAPRLPLHA
jgi:hypothetical protein